jgi:hypothetical protein
MVKKICIECYCELTDENTSASNRGMCKSCAAKLAEKKRAETIQEIGADLLRFIRHEAMRMGVMQDDVIDVMRNMIRYKL